MTAVRSAQSVEARHVCDAMSPDASTHIRVSLILPSAAAFAPSGIAWCICPRRTTVTDTGALCRPQQNLQKDVKHAELDQIILLVDNCAGTFSCLERSYK